ncbi:Tricarboxylate transporter, partial [Phytophthora megakarya]
DGIRSLYRGLVPVLIGSIPKAAIRFGAFDVIKQGMADENGEVSATRNLVAGTIAGGLEAAIAMTPIETLKTKLIGANAGMWEGTKMILRQEGLAGLYQGLSATVLKQSSNQGLRFMCFSEFQKQVSPELLERHGLISDAQNMTGSQRAVLGLVGGMLAGLISVIGNNRTYHIWKSYEGGILMLIILKCGAAFDVVKTRMQGPRAVEYKNTLDCFRHMLLHEGASSFYTGVVPRLGRTIPGQGVIFMSYDTITLFVSRYIEA